MAKLKKTLLFLIFFILSINTSIRVFACTSWAGFSKDHQSVLIAKNRDIIPKNLQTLKIFKKTGEYSYLALVEFEPPLDTSKIKYHVKAGINDQGLTILSLSTSTIPKWERHKNRVSVMKKVLSSYATIDSVLKDQTEVFGHSNPDFLMIADKTKIAYVEIGENHQFKIEEKNSGVLFHTNHFVFPSLTKFNEVDYPSSVIRYDTIKNIMESAKTNLNFQFFIDISTNKINCSDNSDDCIFRVDTGKKHREKTVATWVAELPQNAPPHVFIRYLKDTLTNQWSEVNLILDKQFWLRSS